MQTQLAAQLKSIRVANADVMDYSSILFSPKEASKYNVQSIYSIGRNGIMELIRIDERFQRFDNTLFGNRILSTNRDTLTASENKEIDDLVRDYLFSVSPYMLLKCVQKTLEYLIRRLSIHTFNAEDFFLAVLPYHESTLFPRVFKILKLNSPLFGFLEKVKTTDTPVVRQSLSEQCLKDPAFLDFILSGIRRLNTAGTLPVVHLTLVCSLVIDITRAGAFKEQMVRSLIGFASLGFGSTNTEFQATSLLILSQIAINVTLNNEIITACLNNLLRLEQCNMGQLMECLLIVFRNNSQYVMPVDTAERFLKNATMALSLRSLAEKTSVAPLLAAVIPSLVQLTLNDSSMLDCLKLFSDCSHAEEVSFIRACMESVEKALGDKLQQKQRKNVEKILLSLSADYSQSFDQYLSALPKESAVKELAQKIFSGSSHMVLSNGCTLFLNIENKEYSIRTEVCDLLLQQLTVLSESSPANDRSFVKNSLVSLLEDDFLDLTLKVLSTPLPQLRHVFTDEELVAVLFGELTHTSLQQLNNKQATQVTGAVLKLLHQLNVAESAAGKDTATVCSLYSYMLLGDASYREDCINVLSSLSHPFARFSAPSALTGSTADLISSLAGSLKELVESQEASQALVLEAFQMALTSSVSQFFLRVALSLLSEVHAPSFLSSLACCVVAFAQTQLAKVQPSDVTHMKMVMSDFQTVTFRDLVALPLTLDTTDNVKLLLKVMAVCATSLPWETKDILQQFDALMGFSAHPLSVMSFCYAHFTQQLAFFMTVANYVAGAVWKEEPSAPFSAFLLCSCESSTLIHALNKMLNSVSIQKSLSYSALSSCLLAVLVHLQNPVLAVRSTALLLLETLRTKTGIEEKKSRRGSKETEWTNSEGDHMGVLLQLIRFVLSFKSEIRDDFKLFGIKFSLLFTSEKPAIIPERLSATLLPLILQLEPLTMRLQYLRLCSRMLYTESSEAAVLNRCTTEYQKLSEKKECSPEAVEEWKLLMPLFFRAMSQTTTSQQTFRSMLFNFMSHELSVKVGEGTYAPLQAVLQNVNNAVFLTMNPPEKLSLFHAMLCVVVHIHSVDAVEVYNSVGQLDLTIALLMNEAKDLVNDVTEEERIQIQLMTAFIEVITRNPKFNTDLQAVDPLLLILDRLVAIVKEHAPPRDTTTAETQRATEGAMEIESVGVSDTMLVQSDTLALFYPIQLLLECLHAILTASTSNVRVVTSQQTLQSADGSQPPSKRARRNSISITTEVAIQPQLLVDLIDLNLTTQIKKICLQLLAVLASMHSESVDKHLFACFDKLADRVISYQDEEAFGIIISVLTHCLRQFNNEKQILQVYKSFLSCVPFVPYSQSIQLLNTLIAHSSISYIGHIIAYLLLLNNGVAVGKERTTKPVQNSELASAGIYHFVTSVFMGVNLVPQIQALGVLVSFAEALTDPAYDERKKEKGRTESLTQGLLESLPVQSWREEEQPAVTIDGVVVKFVHDIVSHPTFIGKVATAERESEKIQRYFVHIIENLLLLLQNCTVNKERIGEKARGRARTEEESTLIAGYRSVETSVYDCILVFSEVLTVSSLLTILAVLLKHDDGAIRKRALLMLNKKITDSVDSLSDVDVAAFLSFVQNLVEVASDANEQSVTRQTALLSIHILSQFFAADHPDVFIPAVQTIVTIIGQTTNVTPDLQALKGSAYVALSMLCSTLGVRMLPFLPKFAPSLLKEFEATLNRQTALTEEIAILEQEEDASALSERQAQKEESSVLLQSLVSSLTAVVMNQSGLLSVYLHRIVLLSLSPVLLTSEKTVLRSAVTTLQKTMSEKIEPRLLLPVVIDTLKALPPHAASSVAQLFSLLTMVVEHIPEDKVSLYATKAWTFCVQGLETRTRWEPEGVEESEIAMVEKATVKAMVAITLKLSESQLTPLFIQTVSWMEEKTVVETEKEELPPVTKAIPFFLLVTELSSTFKSIFTSFYGQFFAVMISYLDAFGKACKKEKRESAAQTEQNSLFRLVKQVVLALYRCFLYDSDGWMDEEKFSSVSPPLVKLIGAYFVPEYSTEYGKFMNNYVVPTVVQLVVCTSGHDDWWQSFNHQVLLQTRSPVAAVRLVAIRVIRECFERMSQEYLPLLPDVIPFLADLLEDEDAEVEKMAQELRHQLESLSGEELTSYLTM